LNKKENGRCGRLIESDEFPFEFVSALAQRESWRKEIYRPIYHMHKWWAKRLGSVFRAILLGSVLPEDAGLETGFYQQHDLSHIVLFDPFMGSGVTIGEAHKLGMTALGRDINPVAAESVRVAFTPLDRHKLQAAFQQISATVGRKIRRLYQTVDKNGDPCDVLYYFWVKQVNCPDCQNGVDLFSSYIFAQNAYPKQKPEVQICCPACGDIFQGVYHQKEAVCVHCRHLFDPRNAPAKGSKATCSACKCQFPIIQAIQAAPTPPAHKLYAKLVLTPDGDKKYLPVTSEDLAAYAECERELTAALAQNLFPLPDNQLADGYNTRQAMGYNYRQWRDFFNARQLLALGWLHQALTSLPDEAERDALLTLFSGALEFNNMFASYKGEGTGAVRHIFSHHTLKPERTPIEANLWGTAKSSGSFSGLFRSRLLRALDYRDAPFEVSLSQNNKRYGAAKPMGTRPLAQWGDLTTGAAALSCGDSARSDLPDRSVDLIVTDPPFFDNVHYSELADFFNAWQRLYPRGFIVGETSTRQSGEVQDGDGDQFAHKLRQVLGECKRILKRNGLLVFTYHHSRADGWLALAQAIYGAGFSVVQAHPVYAEMANATPKAQTKEPILLDAILVCRLQEDDGRPSQNSPKALKLALQAANRQLQRVAASGHTPSEGDKFVIGAAQFFVALGSSVTSTYAAQAFRERREELQAAMALTDFSSHDKIEMTAVKSSKYEQLTLAL
jgi:putative DNA methylase